jgi:hypothetical protein
MTEEGMMRAFGDLIKRDPCYTVWLDRNPVKIASDLKKAAGK